MAGNNISKVSGTGVYVQGNDIDTDRIVPARFLKCVTFDELGPALFHDARFTEAGQSRQHVLDDRRHQGANILITDNNFGCGSSREHAPQAIQKFGFQAIIAGSFAEIFQGNCTTLGIPCVVMAAADRQELARTIVEDPAADIVVDLDKMTVFCANKPYSITMKASSRAAFLAATYDPLDNLLSAKDAITKTAEKLGYI